jgi:hypothetical protein
MREIEDSVELMREFIVHFFTHPSLFELRNS